MWEQKYFKNDLHGEISKRKVSERGSIFTWGGVFRQLKWDSEN